MDGVTDRIVTSDDEQPAPPPPRRQRFINAARRRPIWLLFSATVAVSAVLYAFPAIDLWVTGLFYGGPDRFAASVSPFLRDLRELGKEAFRLFAIAIVISLLAPLVASGARFLFKPRDALFLAIAMILGPGLIVNVLLKGFWGRARPIHVEEFGGDMPFTAPWVIAGHCDWNCSFVSGEGSSSIFLMALALIAPLTWRRPVALGAFVFALAISVNRIAFGGHFFSDVVLSWLITLLVILLVHKAVYAPSSGITDERLARVLGGAGDRAKAWLGPAVSAVAERIRRTLALFR